jgi:carbon monoxide dehydrogenase subunit G
MTTQAAFTRMVEIKQEIDIQANPEKIFGILEDPMKAPLLCPDISNVQPAGDNAYNAMFAAKLGGQIPVINISIKYHVTPDQRPKQITHHFTRNIDGLIRWTLEPRGNSTHVTVNANYKFMRKVFDDALGANNKSGGVLGAAANVAGQAVNQFDQIFGQAIVKSEEDFKDVLKRLKAASER